MRSDKWYPNRRKITLDDGNYVIHCRCSIYEAMQNKSWFEKFKLSPFLASMSEYFNLYKKYNNNGELIKTWWNYE